MQVNIEPSWAKILQNEFDKEYFARLTQFVRDEYGRGTCYPPGREIFNAFNLCPLERVRVVILGQDPYHGPGQAEGLCFSVKTGVALPPSLVNIFKEIKADTGSVPQVVYDAGGKPLYDGSLRRWAEQGVLLLNATLTVREHQAGSHQRQGWEQFTDAVVRAIAERKRGVVYMLWGSYAQKKGAIANPCDNLILKAVHPSPLSAYRGFFGCRHFSAANNYLLSLGKEAIEW